MEFVQIKFKELRTLKNMTQPEIAEKLGYKTAMWQKLESGRTPDPRTSTIVHICKTLDVSADWLLDLQSTSQSEGNTPEDIKLAGGKCGQEEGLSSENGN